MRTRMFRLVSLLALASLGVGAVGCWWRHPVEVRREDGRDHHEEHHEDHHDEWR
jgi:hypothetical protein